MYNLQNPRSVSLCDEVSNNADPVLLINIIKLRITLTYEKTAGNH